MKILLATISLSSSRGGGTAQRTRFLARYLKQAGAECQIVTMEDGDIAEGLRIEGIPVYATSFVRPRFHIPLVNLLRLRRLVEWSDASHILGYWNLLSVVLAWLARRHGRPYLLSGAGEFSSLASCNVVKHAFHTIFGKRMIAGAHALVTVTELERQQIIETLKLDPAKVLVVSNGVEAPRGGSSRNTRLPEGRFVVFMGRLAHVKGPDLLLEAFATVAPQFPDVQLVFCGADGGMLKTLQERRTAARLDDRVVFTGFIDEEAREAAYRQSLLLAVPSRDEAMSLVALEAAVLGKSVLLTERCGFNAIETTGGGLVVPATVEGLSRGLTEMLSHPERLKESGIRLQSYVLTNYGWPSIAEQLLAYFRLAISTIPKPEGPSLPNGIHGTQSVRSDIANTEHVPPKSQ